MLGKGMSWQFIDSVIFISIHEKLIVFLNDKLHGVWYFSNLSELIMHTVTPV